MAIRFQATCGTASGVIVATATGGVPPITYNIDGGAFQNQQNIYQCRSGTHTILAKDANGCLSSPQTATITNSGAGAAPTDVTFVVRDLLACTGEGRIKILKVYQAAEVITIRSVWMAEHLPLLTSSGQLHPACIPLQQKSKWMYRYTTCNGGVGTAATLPEHLLQAYVAVQRVRSLLLVWEHKHPIMQVLTMELHGLHSSRFLPTH